MRVRTGIVILALVAAGCGSSKSSSSGGGASSSGGKRTASAPGVTATTVTVGGHFPLTGPAAPGYSEIPQAIDAYFKYVNAHGGVNGRQLKMIARDDGYNPTNTVKVTKQLVLQDKIFAMLGGLGTPTHTKVVDYLNASKVPDIFVSSGCLCWDQPSKHPYTFGWQTDYLVEGKILGQYIADHYKGKKVAYFLQDDDFGADGAKGLDMYVPKADVVARQVYEPGNVDIGPQMAKIAGSGAQVIAMFTIPAYTALVELAGVKLNYHPQLVVSNVGSDATTLAGLLKAFSKGKAPATLINGMVSDTYLPALSDTSNSWITLFKQIHDQYLPKLPFDGNVGYGFGLAYTFAEALQRAGANPTRQSLVDAIQKGGLSGPGLVPFRFSATSHAGYTGVQIGTIKDGALSLTGQPLTTDDASGAIQPYTGSPSEAPSNGIPPAAH
jgi:ABC-type branched-subunit amino acid transport system substrate-binding protein